MILVPFFVILIKLRVHLVPWLRWFFFFFLDFEVKNLYSHNAGIKSDKVGVG